MSKRLHILLNILLFLVVDKSLPDYINSKQMFWEQQKISQNEGCLPSAIHWRSLKVCFTQYGKCLLSQTPCMTLNTDPKMNQTHHTLLNNISCQYEPVPLLLLRGHEGSPVRSLLPAKAGKML